MNGTAAVLVDLVGQTFGRWTVIERAPSVDVGPRGNGSGHKKHTMYLCRCECGTERAVRSANLRRGQSISCGCYPGELGRVLGGAVG